MANKVIVEVCGGVVQEVYSDNPETKIVLIDWDTDGSLPSEQDLFAVQDAHGRDYLVWAIEFPSRRLEEMPRETQEAVGKAT